MKFLPCLLLPVLLAGCASQVPPAIREPLANAPTVQSVRGTAAGFTGQRVRWGGVIAGIENHQQDTWIEVVDHPLEHDGHPLASDASGGRFVARIPGFLDPVIYAQGRELTVTGVLAASIIRPVGDYPYRHPVVDVDSHYLWPKPQPAPHPPYYYDPFRYGPLYPPWYAPRPPPR